MSEQIDDNFDEEYIKYDFGEDAIDEEEIVEKSPLYKIFMGAVALAVVAGLLYMSGIYQYLFFQKTSPSAIPLPIETRLDAETLTVPLTVFIVRGSEQFGSDRSEEDVLRLVEKASEILGQAAISLLIKEIHTLPKTDEEAWLFLMNTPVFVRSIEEVDPQTINVFLTRNLQGINGIAYSGLSSVGVADSTTVNDFRVLAHEVGHILGLEHVSESNGQLMYRGANGIDLSPLEIEQARLRAEAYE